MQEITERTIIPLPTLIVKHCWWARTSTATVSITGVTARLEHVRNRGGGWWTAAGGLALALFLPLGFGVRRRAWRAFFSALLLLAMAAGLSSCNELFLHFRPVPPGSYSVTVTATLGSDTHKISIPVTVQ